MGTGVRRGLFVGGAVLALVAGGLGTLALRSARDGRRAGELARQADAARGQAQDVLKARLADLEGRTGAAASLPVLRAQIGVVDATTLRDGFHSEPWWQSVREAFPVYGVSFGDGLDLLEGASRADFDASALLRAAREKRQASAVLARHEVPLLAGAALIDRPGLKAVLLLGKPIDVALLDEISARVHGAVMLTDGHAPMLAVGRADEREHLRASLGSEGSGLHAGEGWVAAAATLAPGVFLWVHGRGGDEASGVPLDLVGLWAISLAIAGVLLALGFKKAPAFQTDPDLPPLTMMDEEAVSSESQTQATNVSSPRPARTGTSNPGKARTGATGGGNTNPGAVRTGPNAAAPRSATNPGAAAARQGAKPTGTTGPGVTGPQGRRRTGTTGPEGPARTGSSAPVSGGPQRFGRYWLLDRLGEGGMAEVYLALAFGAENFRRTFVLKRLRGDAVKTSALVNMFIDEAKIASTLIHGNIIPVFDFGKEGDEYFIAQEYILGRDLRRVTTRAMEKDGAPLPERLIVFIMREVLRALDYAHSATGEGGRPINLVHRDVSPNNVLVSSRGEVKLFDFGIAKADEGRLTQTQTGVVKGNIRFMSPEQARGETVDLRADLASLGLVLYFALKGETLYEGDTGYVLLMQAAMGLTPETEAKLALLPPALGAIVRKAISPREERYQDAAEFEQALSTLPSAGGSDLRKMMDRLFGEDLKAEEARLEQIQLPPDAGETIEWGSAPGEDQPA